MEITMRKSKAAYTQKCACGQPFTADSYSGTCDKIMDHHAKTNWQCCDRIWDAWSSPAGRELRAKGIL